MELILAEDIRLSEVNFKLSDLWIEVAEGGTSQLNLDIGGNIIQLQLKIVGNRDPEELVGEVEVCCPVFNQGDLQINELLLFAIRQYLFCEVKVE